MKNILKTIFIGLGVSALIFFLLNLLVKPAMTIACGGFNCIVMVSILAFAISGIITCYQFDEENYIVVKAGFSLIGIYTLLLIIFAIASSKMTNAYNYRDTVNIVESEFSDVVSSADEMPIVDKENVDKLADRTMGQMPSNVASQYEVSNTYNMIQYNGKTYYIAPLEYGGLFKYNKSKNAGIPGYVLVDVSSQEANIVLDKTFNYSPSAFFSNDLNRHLRNTYPSYLFGDFIFEVDDEGNPYWVTSVLSAKAGIWGNKVVSSVIVTDAKSGLSTEYSLDDVPSWVDNVYSVSYLMDKASNYFTLVKGYNNSLFAKVGVKDLSYSYRETSHTENSNTQGLFTGYSTFVCNGNVSFFTGVTSSGKDESIYGFIVCNARTGEVKYVNCPGAEESSAMAAAEGLVKNMQYTASYPVIINVNGIETYFIVLRDTANIVKGYALVNVKNYTIAVNASTINEAIVDYTKLCTGELEAEIVVSEEVDGIIEEVFQAIIEGYTYFYYTLEGDDNLYMSPITNGNMQVTYKTGDRVMFKVTSSQEENVIFVTEVKLMN